MRRTLVCLLLLLASPALAQEAYERWEILPSTFGSTGGNGVVIAEYRVRHQGAICTTPFTATDAAGTVYRNIAEFDATPIQGGILCSNGRWRSAEGSASGTTPLRVFLKDGVQRGSP